MADPRIVKLAGILVDYSLTVKKGSIIKISLGYEARDLGLEVYKRIIRKGGLPIVNCSLPGFAYQFYKLASNDQLKTFPKIAEFEAKNIDGVISIGTDYNTKEFTNIDPKKVALRSRIIRPISDMILQKNNWVICEYPTNALAQDAEMSLEEFEDFVYSATNVDWNKEAERQKRLKTILDKGSVVRIVGKDTDLTFSIKGRQGIMCCGHRNMPDGEVFVGPDETTAEGHIAYSFPAIHGGREVDGIRLEFHKGKVVSAKASKNEGFLKEMIATDPGASLIGEFGIGLNYNIKRFIKQILFDEKIGGTIHLALGMAYKEGGGKNESALHWDMIKDLRDGGKIIIDGKVIQENGKFMVKL